jgi:hypothetical protein
MFTSPIGAPASYAAVKLSDELDAALKTKIQYFQE